MLSKIISALARSRQTFEVIAVRGFALALAFALQIVLARHMGVSGYGVFSLAFSSILVLTILAQQGHDIGAMRVAAPLIFNRAIVQIKRYRQQVGKGIWILGGIITVLIASFTLLNGYALNTYWPVLAIMALSVPMIARSRFSQGLLRAAEKPTLAYLPEGILPPLVMIPLVFLISHLSEITASTAAALFFLAAITNFAVARLLEMRVFTSLGHDTTLSPQVTPQNEGWKNITRPMFISSLLIVANDQVVFFLIGAMLGDYAAGLFSAASRFMIIAGMIATTLYLAHASRFSVLFEKKNLKGLSDEARRVTRFVLLLTIVVCLPLLVWADFFLGFFGPDFANAVTPMRILVLASLLQASFGPVGLLLNMCAQERAQLGIVGLNLVVSLVLGLALVPTFGITGAALAVLLSTALRVMHTTYLVRKTLGFSPLPLGKIKPFRM